jgi:hypothetical protein
MNRRHFFQTVSSAAVPAPGGAQTSTEARVLMPELPAATPVGEAVLFAFDNRAFPFTSQVDLHLIPGARPQFVLPPGPEGSHDEVILYYGTTIRVGDTFHMWYNGNAGALDNTIGYERVEWRICYATSKDGVSWTKPNLGLVEYKGSKQNNIVDFHDPHLWSSCAALHDPEDPSPARRFKMVYEVKPPGGTRFSVAFSPDGLRWTHFRGNPVGPALEMAGITRYRGLSYVNGQGGRLRMAQGRRLATFASVDFERWSPVPALGLDRTPDVTGPLQEARGHDREQVHLGAALWNRGNVLVGIYGQWHGHPSDDRKLLTMDLGLAISHDGLHFQEPIAGFPFIPARDQPGSTTGVGAALMQGQGMENAGDRTLYWYSIWRGTPGSGVRLVSWERDRLGYIKPFDKHNPRVISSLLRVVEGQSGAYLNASGLGEYSRIRVGLMDEGFQPIAGYGVDDALPLVADGLRIPLRWKAHDRLPGDKAMRLDVRFEGVRPEDCRLHAAYVGSGALSRG